MATGNMAALQALHQIQSNVTRVNVGVDERKNAIVIDRPFPLSDVEVPLKPGRAREASAAVGSMMAKFRDGQRPTEEDASLMVDMVDVDWSKFR